MTTQKKKTELQLIREEFQASRPQFGKVFLGGLTKSTIYNYETQKKPIPQRVMMLARMWKSYLDTMRGENEKV